MDVQNAANATNAADARNTADACKAQMQQRQQTFG